MPEVRPRAPASLNRNSMPSYGWDSSLTQMGAGGMAWGSSSVPSTPVGNPYFQQPHNQQFSGLGGHIPAQNNNFYAGTVSGFASTQTANAGGSFPSSSRPMAGKSATLPGNRTMANDSSVREKTTGDSSVPDGSGTGSAGATGGDTGFNLVPNVDFDAWNESDSFFAQYEHSDNRSSDASYKKHQRKSSDLIQLGFEGILTSEEKEYFSLEYFDPLHRKGRTSSISSPSMSSSHYFFAKPPEETELVSNDRNKWVTFEEEDVFFGRDEGDQDVSKASGDTTLDASMSESAIVSMSKVVPQHKYISIFKRTIW